MITPRETRLIRTPNLRAFQRAIAGAACGGGPADQRGRVVIVPTRAAAETLRRTLEHLWLGAAGAGGRPAALALPDLVTRAEWYRGLRERLPGARPLVTDLEREVIFRRAARAATEGGFATPFPIRSGLVAAILEFYDGLRRRRQSVEAFERLTVESLERDTDTDRGAVRMLQQTRFLVAAFRAYDRLLEESGLADEHTLREALLARAPVPALAHAVVTVADEIADRRGLWPADFDLLTRLPGLTRIDVVATEEVLATGWHERLHTLLPGIVEARGESVDARQPHLIAPPQPDGRLYWVSRDREEELADAARRAKGLARREGPDALDRFAVVFQRPLPYVYLARQIFAAAGVPYQASDALPLAAEPFAAAVDLVCSAVTGGFSRGAAVALLRSPHFRFQDGGRPIGPDDVAALDAVLRQIRFLGGRDRLAEVAADLDAGRLRATRRSSARDAAAAARALAAVARRLPAVEREDAPSGQLAALAAFIRDHEVLPGADAPWRARHHRVRAAILGAIDALGAAHARFDDHPRSFADLAATIRRWIEAQTFSPRTGRAGVHLVDASAARYGDFDEVRLAGLVDTDWPESIPRTVFYPAGLLAPLGWPPDRERRLGARAAFVDLVRLAPLRVSLSTFTLEDDALARPSPLLEDLADIGLSAAHDTAGPAPRIFVHEALSEEPVAAAAVRGEAAQWLALRAHRPPAASPEFHGTTDPRRDPPYRPSAVERYLQCPFKYFADRVLHLEEEREEEPGLTPQERGLLLHEILQAFFTSWRDDGRGAITVENFNEALAAFSRVAEARLATLGDADRALERTRLLGSAVATGLAQRAFEFETGTGVDIVERLLEHPLEGTFTLQGPDGPHTVDIRGKADRLDLLSDGTLRVIDYKLGSAPKPTQAIQLPVYGACAQQQLEGHRGRRWTFGAAGYVAFGDPRSFVSLETRGTPFAEAVREGQARFLEAIQGIERGRFPVQPAEPYRCTYCAYPAVCRKDYVGDE